MLELKYKPYFASYSAVFDDLVIGNPMFEQLEDLPTIPVIPESEETMDGLRDVLDSITGASVQAEGDNTNSRSPAAFFRNRQKLHRYTVVLDFEPLQDKVEFHNMLLRELCELYVIRRGNQYCLSKIPTEGIPERSGFLPSITLVIGSKSGFLAYVAILAGRQFHGGRYRAAGADGTIGHWRGYHGDSDPSASLRTSAAHCSVLSKTA
jgi:hypothetical protein